MNEFSLMLRPRDTFLQLLAGLKSIKSRQNPTEKRTENEASVCVYSNQIVLKGACFLPFQGTIRLDRLEVYSTLNDDDIRNKFGCFDEIRESADGAKVRHCNWIRFVTITKILNENVNFVGHIVRGEVVYECIQTIAPNREIVVYFDLKNLESNLLAAFYPTLLAASPLFSANQQAFITRQAIQDSPLDLSMSLLASPSESSSISSSSSFSDAHRNTDISLDLVKKSPVTEIKSEHASAPSSPESLVHDESLNKNLTEDEDIKVEEDDDDDDNEDDEEDVKVEVECFVDEKERKNRKLPPLPKQEIMTDFETMKALANHLVVKKPRERTMLPCEYCGKAFDRPSLLRRHLRTHTGEKPHVCDVCGKGFSTSSSLNTHRRIHSGEKPHQCPICGKRFTASSNLYYHRMTHNKVKPHACTLCSKSFPTPGDLKSHMYVHNGSWPFKCSICNRGFSKQTNLRNHMLLHSGDRPHECEICQKKFALQCNLRAHMKTHEESSSSIGAASASTGIASPPPMPNASALLAEATSMAVAAAANGGKCLRCAREFTPTSGMIAFGCCKDCLNETLPLLMAASQQSLLQPAAS